MLVQRRHANTPAIPMRAPSHHQARSAPLTVRRICVGRGTAWPRSAKITAKRGTTKVRRNAIAPTLASVTIAG